jgi:hypothetical protein
MHEKREFKSSANGQYILFCEDQLGHSLPLAAQLSFFPDAGHVLGRVPVRAQRAAWSGGSVNFLERYLGTQQHGRVNNATATILLPN